MPNNITEYIQAMHEDNQVAPERMSVGELMEVLSKFDRSEVVSVNGWSEDGYINHGELYVSGKVIMEFEGAMI